MVLALSVFLLGAGALCVDMSNLWFHRQAAQNAADSACTAGAMDLLVDAQGGATGHQGFVNGTAFNCSVASTAAPCKYAAMNGYTSNNTSPGSLVSVTFPASVAGVPSGTVPPASLAPTTFMRVDVTDNVQTFFSGMLSGNRTQTVRAFAACGVVLAKAPIPILVLDPLNPVVTPPAKALDIQGTPTIKIVGGPSQSIQVNSECSNRGQYRWQRHDQSHKRWPQFRREQSRYVWWPCHRSGGICYCGQRQMDDVESHS